MADCVLYLGTSTGLFRAEGNGRGFETSPLGLDGGSRCPVVIDKSDQNTLYAGTMSHGVLRSSDRGRSWIPANNGLTKPEVWWIEQHPKTGELWAGVSPAAMFKSSDQGESWSECDQLQSLPTIKEWSFPPPPHISHVKHISLRPDDPNDILGAVEEGWLIRSRDGGATWTNLQNGCEFDSHTAYFMPNDPRVIVSTSGRGIYRSEDDGQSFVSSCDGLDRRYMAHLAVHPAHPSVLFTAAAAVPPPGWARPEGANSGIYRSDDQGRRWHQLSDGLPEQIQAAPRCVAGDPQDADSVYVGLTDGSVWMTHDGGQSFSKALALSPAQASSEGRFGGITSIRVGHN